MTELNMTKAPISIREARLEFHEDIQVIKLNFFKEERKIIISNLQVFLFFFLAMSQDMWDFSYLTRDRTRAPCSGSTES